ncbi:hypothetical protein CXR04_16610 [Streptomyces sp. CMB-StM0423]|nr:hypothetical protein CXR04_16610 [Streptomyces sp. CMB-StM0423]
MIVSEAFFILMPWRPGGDAELFAGDHREFQDGSICVEALQGRPLGLFCMGEPGGPLGQRVS